MKTLEYLFQNPLKLIAIIIISASFPACETYIPPCSSECKNVSTPHLKCSPVIGTFTDARDGQVYETVTICDQTWMAENLKYDTPDSILNTFYGSVGDSLNIYTQDSILDGKRVYNFASALYACPAGWHLPSNSEWNILEINLGINPLDTINPTFWRGCCIAPMLMSEVGWNGIGTNESKFNLVGPSSESLWTSTFNYYPSPLSMPYEIIYPITISFLTYRTKIFNSPHQSIFTTQCIRCIQD